MVDGPVASSEAANRVRWDGRPGFFEIWFVVVFDPAAPRAWWLRWTTFAPAPGSPGTPRATLWVAAFDARAATPVRAAKRILPPAARDANPNGRFRVRIGDAELRVDGTRGAIPLGGGELAWDLRWTPAPAAARHAPALLSALPLPTRVAHVHDGARADGWVALDGAGVALHGAPVVQKHLWGTRRVEELFWLHCPRLDGDAPGRIEATAVRLRRGGGLPPLVTLRAAVGTKVLAHTGLAAVPRNRCERLGPTTLRWRAAGLRHRIVATATCDPATLAGWVYRDPSGFDLHVAQSDVASCTLDVETRPHPLAAWRHASRLTCRESAALEFHAPEPLPGVAYVPWDEEAPS